MYHLYDASLVRLFKLNQDNCIVHQVQLSENVRLRFEADVYHKYLMSIARDEK